MIGSQERMCPLLSWRVWCCNKCDQTHHYKTLWKKVDCFGLLCQQQPYWNTKHNLLKYVNVMRRVVSFKPMPWSHFTNGAFPGSSRAVFGLFLAGVPSIFSPHAGPGLLLILTEKKPGPGEKYITYQACKQSGRGSAGPLSGSTRNTGTIFEGQHAGYPHAPPPPPYGTVAEAYRIPTWLVGDPGGVPPVPSRCPSVSRSGPLYDFQGDTQLQRDAFINVQSINPSIN